MTLPAYERAVAERADGLECDVRLTRDGRVVCLHDRSVDRVSDGRGLVSRLTLAELRGLNFGSDAMPLPVLTLAELLEFYQDTRHENVASPDEGWVFEAGQSGSQLEGHGKPSRELFIETKHPQRHGGLLEKAVHAELDRAGLRGDAGVHVISFSWRSLINSRRLDPGLSRILLRRDWQRALYPVLERAGAADSHGISLVTGQAQPEAIGRAGQGTYMWTVDEADQVRWAARQGVTWLATNVPGQARAWRDSLG